MDRLISIIAAATASLIVTDALWTWAEKHLTDRRRTP